ncbi:MAG: diaminopropionate ammonia-lyase, partial [Synergistaceae bacterium]|nr:diaminopropionate ammonia-lyase [Synergistaceae bacterium]
RIISGESGASTSGFVCELLQNQSLDYLREMLEVGSDSRLLCFSTEGDTDRRNYRSIVWDGLHPSF